MNPAQTEIAQIIAAEGVLARRQHPHLAEAARWWQRRGVLVPVLPGVLAPSERAGSFDTRLAAVAAWRPDAVVTGASAARITFWDELTTSVLELALPRPTRVRAAGFRLTERRVPPQLVRTRGRLRVTAPELTALDLCATVGGDAIDRVLLRRAATLEQLKAALAVTPNRRGNAERARLLLDSRDEPWSRAERETHILFRAAGLVGWTTNVRVELDASTFFIDIAFEGLRIAIEIDGRKFHSSAEAFEQDRRRQNLLVLDGWRVLRFTWPMITEDPARVVEVVREAVETAAWMAR